MTLDELIARESIRDLVARYNANGDSGRFDQVVELMAIALPRFTPRECLNFVQHCGYRVSTAL